MRHRVRSGASWLIAVTALVAACAHGSTDTAPVSSVPATTTSTTPTSSTSPPTSAPAPTTTAASAPTTTAPIARFAWRSALLSPQVQALMSGRSWRPGCPVQLSDLRLVDAMFWGFDGTAHWGQVVVNSASVTPVVGALHALFDARFPVRQMRLVDYFAADDEASMAADNTSAFNCRRVPGSSTWSEHAYGRAIDLNPLENPEIRDGQVDPPSGAPWADRSQTVPGMIHRGDPAWAAFNAVGWKWGGDWISLKDYQHFSATGL